MVTWKDKAAAAEEIGQCAAVALDMMSTIHSQKLDPFAVETSPLLGKHPGPVTLSIAGLAQCLLESAYTQWGHEYLDGDKAYGAQLTGLVLSGVLHGQAINTNEQNASQAAARARLAPGAVK
jgi:hypothetical protein